MCQKGLAANRWFESLDEYEKRKLVPQGEDALSWWLSKSLNERYEIASSKENALKGVFTLSSMSNT